MGLQHLALVMVAVAIVVGGASSGFSRGALLLVALLLVGLVLVPLLTMFYIEPYAVTIRPDAVVFIRLKGSVVATWREVLPLSRSHELNSFRLVVCPHAADGERRGRIPLLITWQQAKALLPHLDKPSTPRGGLSHSVGNE